MNTDKGTNKPNQDPVYTRPPNDPLSQDQGELRTRRVGKDFTAWNEAMARKYDPDLFHRHRNPLIRWLERMRVSAVVGSLGARPRERILEVGCGAGNLLKAVPAGILHGTDLSTFVLGKARRLLSGRATLTRSAGEGLPYRDACFDKVYCSEVLEHLAGPVRAVAEMARVLKPGGVLVLSVPNEDWVDRLKSLAGRLGLYAWAFESGDFRSPEANEWHLHRFDPAGLRGLAGGQLVCRRMLTLPSKVFPVHYVAVLTKPARAAARDSSDSRRRDEETS